MSSVLSARKVPLPYEDIRKLVAEDDMDKCFDQVAGVLGHGLKAIDALMKPQRDCTLTDAEVLAAMSETEKALRQSIARKRPGANK